MYVHNARQVANGGATASLMPARDTDRLMMRWDKTRAIYTAAVVRVGNRTSRARFIAGHTYRLQPPREQSGIGEARLVSIINIQPMRMSMADITACGFTDYGALTDAFEYNQRVWLLRWADSRKF